jgi:glycosyltransferase involved in cell wall biosynthesis
LYLKTDLWFSTQVGGSVTHMAGVANHLAAGGWSPWVFATASNPLLSAEVRANRILPDESFWDFREVPALRFSRKICGNVKEALGGERPAFIYQRYSLNNYAAVRLAQHLSVPLVTEYNGSEVWISQNWGHPVAYPQISEEIERLNLDAADLIVVVSTASKDELISRGVDSSRILINPNGVDAEFFNPKVEDSELRRTLGLAGCRVIGFIGTFGPWHGTEELVRAFSRLLERFPEKKEKLHLLMVGDGVMRNAAEKMASELNIHQYCTFTGQVPQVDGPRYLACCDILVAPQVPNPDGTPFFGSPTKLFEYMAMGRPIVASRLGQMEEVLDHGQTAWLVEPGDPEALADGIANLLADEGLCSHLGETARGEVLAKHTWQVHVNRILCALQGTCQ